MTTAAFVWFVAMSLAHAQTGGLGTVGPPAGGPRSDAVVVRTTTWCYPSGLRVMYEQQPGRPDITLLALVAGGSSADPAERDGLAHFAEHLFFRQPWVDASTTETGAYRNATTTTDDTMFLTVANRRYVRDVLNVEVRRLTEPLALDPSVFATEREVVHSELRQNWDDTAQVGLLELYPQLFDVGHPYHHRPIGTHATLDAITAGEVVAWSAARNQPANVAWSVVADFPPEKFAALLGNALPRALVGEGDPVGCGPMASAWPMGGDDDILRPGAAAVTPEPSRRFVEVPAAVGERSVLVGWALPPGQRAAALARFDLWLLDGTLGEDRPASCFLLEMASANLGVCVLELLPNEDPAHTTRRLLGRADSLWAENSRDVLSLNYATFAQMARRDLFGELDTGATAGEDVLRWFHRYGDVAALRTRLAALALRDWSEAAQFGVGWLKPDDRYGAVVLVPDDVDRWPVAFHAARELPPPAGDAESVDRDRLAMLVAEPDLSGVVRFALPNGLQVHLLPWGNVPYARAALLFRHPDPGGVPLLTDYAVSGIVSLRSTQDLNTVALGSYASWATGAGEAHLLWEIAGPDAVAMTSLLAARIGQARVRPRSPQAWLDDRLDARAGEPVTGDTRAAELRAEHLYPDRPVGLDPDTVEAAKAALSRRGAIAYAEDMLDPAGADLIVVGGFDPAEVEKAVRAQFSPWRNTAISKTAPPSAPLAGPRDRAVFVVPDDLHRVLAEVTVACRVDGDTATDVEWPLLNDALSDDLNARIREQAAASYGVDVHVDRDPAGSALSVSTRVPKPAVGMAVDAILDTLGQARAGMSDAVLARWKLLVARRSALRWRTAGDLFDWLVSAALYGVPATSATGLADRLDRASAASVAQRLAPCAGAEVVTVVGDGEPVTAGLDAASIRWTRP